MNANKYRAGADAVLVAALAAGATQGGAAEQAGVSVSTMQRHLQDESFRAESTRRAERR